MAKQPAKRSAKKSARPKRPADKKTGPTIEEYRQFVRREGARYLASPNINSVGVGLKVDTAKGRTDEVCVQFTFFVAVRQ